MREASESSHRRLKYIFKPPHTRWVQVLRVAWIFSIIYLIVLFLQIAFGWAPQLRKLLIDLMLVVPAEPGGAFKWEWSSWVRDILNAGFAVSLLIISLWYGGILADFYE